MNMELEKLQKKDKVYMGEIYFWSTATPFFQQNGSYSSRVNTDT